jgi:DNA helicase IV
MNQTEKNKIFDEAKIKLAEAREKINMELASIIEKGKKRLVNLKRAKGADRFIEEQLFLYNEKRREELEKLAPSPYFTKCEVAFGNESEIKTYHIAKFPFTEEGIYSWVAPISRIRFEDCGSFVYERQDGKKTTGKLLQKDQFMIVDGKIMFLSTESVENKRELVYQEYFSNRKGGFVLPEIVEQMEKSQDQVIRADHIGPLVITGPAGSGKTTLALHRVAYLAQSPETGRLFPGNQIIVFVQDSGTKKYFSALLPELGIDNVEITTFFEWAAKILNLQDFKFFPRFGKTEEDKNYLEYKKNLALKNEIKVLFSREYFQILKDAYLENDDDRLKKILKFQEEEKVLDQFDLAMLLGAYFNSYGNFQVDREYYLQKKDFVLQRKIRKEKLNYSLVIVDEFQNYLAEQLRLIRNAVDKNLESIVYVGDINQQINYGTIKKLEETGSAIDKPRVVELKKVYRNTRSILEYINKLGFNVKIPEGLKEGTDVVEKVLKNIDEEIFYIKNILSLKTSRSVGILSFESEYLVDFKNEFNGSSNIHCLSAREAQGVEFDVVVLVGINSAIFKISADNNLGEDYFIEKRRINKDLLYVALTRANQELHVLGRDRLSEVDIF